MDKLKGPGANPETFANSIPVQDTKILPTGYLNDIREIEKVLNSPNLTESIHQYLEDKMKGEFSKYKPPISNVRPEPEPTNILKIYHAVREDFYKAITEEIRAIDDKKKRNKLKAERLPYITPHGTFTTRHNDNLILHSGLICLDVDGIKDPEVLKMKISKDPFLNPELIYTSPGGAGLKVFVKVDIEKGKHEDYFDALRRFMHLHYGIDIDSAGRDVSRACFLCHDPGPYIHPKYLQS